MKAYKGFNKDLVCTMGKGRFQYEVGKTYKEDSAQCASTGFHCVEEPVTPKVEPEPERIAPEDVEIVENTKCETDFEETETVLAENETKTVENGTEKVPEAAEILNAEQNPGRLTESDEFGNWGVKGLSWGKLQVGQVITQEVSAKLYGCLCKLKDYEKTGLSPEEVERLQEDR